LISAEISRIDRSSKMPCGMAYCTTYEKLPGMPFGSKRMAAALTSNDFWIERLKWW
jgi:hypothetical protein